MYQMQRELLERGYNIQRIDTGHNNRNKHIEEIYRNMIEGMKYGIATTDPDVTVTKIYADNKEMAEAMTINGETKIDLKFGNDPMVDKQYREDLFGDNDAKLEIETGDDMLEALARFYSNYHTGNETRDEVAARMSSWLLELQELRAMKKNLKNFIKDFTAINLDETLSTKSYDNIRAEDYHEGRRSVFNAISSKIGTYNLDFYNRDEVE